MRLSSFDRDRSYSNPRHALAAEDDQETRRMAVTCARGSGRGDGGQGWSGGGRADPPEGRRCTLPASSSSILLPSSGLELHPAGRAKLTATMNARMVASVVRLAWLTPYTGAFRKVN